MPTKSPDRLFEGPQTEVSHFLEVKRLEAQNTLLKGFLHEVNNALAGIGTLAEVLKGNIGGIEPENLGQWEQNLSLMANAANKSGVLQRRIRALYSSSTEDPSECNVGLFLRENKDLMELMMPHSQRLAFVIAESNMTIKTTRGDLWELVAIILMWIKTSAAPKASFEWTEAEELKISLFEGQIPAGDSWGMAFECLAGKCAARAKVTASELRIAF